MIKLKSVFIIIYIALTLLMFLTFLVTFKVWISFFTSAFILLLITVYHLYYERNYSPFLSCYIVFNFLFFLAAPISQISSFSGIENPLFITKFPYEENLVVYTNILIGFFNIIFLIFYIFFKKKILNNHIVKQTNTFSLKILPFNILIFTVICLLIFISSYDFIQDEFSRPSWLQSKFSISTLLLWKKFMFFIPFATIIMCFQYFKKTNKKKNNLLNIILFFIIVVLLLFWFKNPLTEKRNALGPIYISLIYLFIPRILNTNTRTISFMFFSMIVVFPLSAIITHSDASLLEIYNNPMILIKQMKGGGITNAFNTLNYDAFFNFNASIDYVYKNGFSYGYQLLSGLFFFIPRSLWNSKPVSSGELIGDYLVSDYEFGFTNLSNPLVSESFINFGIIGVILYPIILAYVFVKMLIWLKSENYLKKIMAFYFAMHLIFFLRGDFTNGYSYYVGPLLAVVYLPSFFEFLTKKALKK